MRFSSCYEIEGRGVEIRTGKTGSTVTNSYLIRNGYNVYALAVVNDMQECFNIEINIGAFIVLLYIWN